MPSPGTTVRGEHGAELSPLSNGQRHAGQVDDTPAGPSPSDDEGLDEVTVPSPVDRAAHDQQQHLEDTLASKELTRSARGSRPSWQHRLVTISYLIFFSILGTLARLGLQWLTFYPGAPVVTSVLWANVGGSWLMGFLSEDRRLFSHPLHHPGHKGSGPHQKQDHSKAKKTIPLYVGLATGFCGSFTSFSSFMRDAFLALSNDLPSPYSHPFVGAAPALSTTYPRSDGYSVLAVLAVIISEVGLSLCALIVGAHTAISLDAFLGPIPYRLSIRLLDPLILILGPGCWLGAVFLASFTPNTSWRGEVLFAIVFAPLGCLVRFYASLGLNPLVKQFPMGTFAVNMFGSIIEAMLYDLQRVRIGSVAGGSVLGCQVLQGLQDGFCGCLTTVSTWVSEIQGLRRLHGYTYALLSVFVGLGFMVIIMGGVRWSIGWIDPSCVTMRTVQ